MWAVGAVMSREQTLQDIGARFEQYTWLDNRPMRATIVAKGVPSYRHRPTRL